MSLGSQLMDTFQHILCGYPLQNSFGNACLEMLVASLLGSQWLVSVGEFFSVYTYFFLSVYLFFFSVYTYFFLSVYLFFSQCTLIFSQCTLIFFSVYTYFFLSVHLFFYYSIGGKLFHAVSRQGGLYCTRTALLAMYEDCTIYTLYSPTIFTLNNPPRNVWGLYIV